MKSIFLLVFLSVITLTPFNEIRRVNAEEAPTIRVGFCKVDGFVSYDDLGNQQGYYVDYLERVAQITGWNYEFVELSSMGEGQQKLENREIDLLAPCKIDAELLSKFDCSNYSFGTEYSVLVTKIDNTDIYYEDYQGMDKSKIGVLSGISDDAELTSYMKDNGFEAELVYFDGWEALNDALEDGTVNLALLNQMMVDEDSQKIVARFAPFAYYFITQKGNEDVLDNLNNAMQNLKNTYPGLENELLTTYFPHYNILYFTRDEQEFIDSLGTIKVAYLDENTPISFKNGNGQLDGISRGIFDKIQEVSGLKFEYELLPEGDITYDYLREQGFDLITGVRYNRSNLYSRGILLTNPYLSSKMVLIGNADSEFDIEKPYTVAVVSGSQTLKNEITTNYPNLTVVTANSIEECFEYVRSGKTDLLMTDRYMANYWLSKPIYEKFYTLPVDELTDELSFSVVVDIYGSYTLSGLDGVKLVNILNKTLSQISEDEIDEIIMSENNEHRYKYVFDDFLYIYRYAVWIGMITIVIIAAFGIYIQEVRRRAIKSQENEAKRIELQNIRYQKMMDSSGEMLYDINIMGEGGFTSEHIKNKFGWSLPEKVTEFSSEGLRTMFHIHPGDWSKECERVTSDLENNIPCDCTVRIMAQNTKRVWCRIYFYPLYNDKHQFVSIIGKIEDVDKDIKEKNQLKHDSQTDSMTGLLNKRTFEERAEGWLSERLAYNCAVLFVDLDHFKNLNDTLGHSIGDEAIKDAATSLQRLFDDVDLVSRFGGDEFCILAWDIPKVKLKDKLKKIVEVMHMTYTDNSESVDITASVGAVYCTKRDSNFKTLLNLADIALYEAKDKGRNQFILKEF
jgi:diguanylate cyclase (GGDEF)-like protein